jgi:hypothetical protein
MFAIGPAAGFVRHGKLGGEPSFRGQANGLWLWQSDVGALIVDVLLTPRQQEYEEPDSIHRPYADGPRVVPA